MRFVRLPKSQPLCRSRRGTDSRSRAGQALKIVAAVSAVLMPALAGAAPWEPNNNVQLPDEGQTSQKVELVDIDADGWVDIVFANSKGEGLINGGQANAELSQLLLNDQGQGFTELGGVFEEPHNSWVIKVGDIDNDGDADLVVGDSFNGSMSHVLLNEGNKMFTREDIVGSANATIGDLELGDVDLDGDLDIVATDWGPLPHGQIDDPGNPLKLWVNDGNGTFTDGSAKLAMGTEVKAAWSFDLELVDINNDYALDIMVSTRGDADPAVVMLNDGEGNFSLHPVPALQPMNSKNINVAFTPMDFDGDGSIDVITLQDGGLSQCVGDPPVCARRNSVLINDGAGGFTIPMNYWAAQFNPGKNDFDAATVDWNNDGKPDVVLIGTSINNGVNSRLLLNDGVKFFAPPLPNDVAFPVEPSLGRTTSLMFADFNQDRREDVAVAQRDASLPNLVLFGQTEPAEGVPEDMTPPRIYDDNIGDKLGTLLFFGKDAGLDARVNDYKTPTHWHDFEFDTDLATYNLIGDGAALTGHNRRLPYMEMALSLDNPDDIKSLPDGDPKKYIAPSIWFGESLWRVNFKVPYNQMAEDTLTWQYCAIDAAGNKTCLGPFSVKVEIDPNDCGDGEVQEWETCDSDSATCIECQETCGNGTCDPNENGENCPEDCGPNPCDNDGACEPPENAENCPDDCDYDGVCGDDICQNPPETPENCPDDCGPCDNDGACEPPEDAMNCPDDCDYDGICGDDICQNPPENGSNCPEDCGGDPTEGSCGNGVCDPSETVTSCPEDCAVCGDGICTDPPENAENCPADCNGASASDGECPDTAGGVDGQCQLDDDGCGCVAEPEDGTRGLWASLLLFGVFGVRRFRKRA